MDAIQFISENVDPITILEHYNFRNIKERETTIRACCEIHKGTNQNAFVWNKDNNLWYCYTGDCGGGDVFTLVQKMENVDFKTSIGITAKILNLDIANMTIDVQEARIKREQNKWIKTQIKNKKAEEKEYKIPYSKYEDTSPQFNRFSTNTIQYYNSKFCKIFPTENGILTEKLTIPIYKNNKLLAVALRSLNNSIPKWLFQPKGFKKANTLYNIDKIIEMNYEEVILVEGIFDVWKFHEIGIDNVVAIFGSSISETQYKLLMKMNVAVTMCFDADNAGKKCTQKTKEKLLYKTELKTITLPENKDPADCTNDELMSAYLNRKEVIM